MQDDLSDENNFRFILIGFTVVAYEKVPRGQEPFLKTYFVCRSLVMIQFQGRWGLHVQENQFFASWHYSMVLPKDGAKFVKFDDARDVLALS